MANKGPSKYKGVPRDQWASVRAAGAAVAAVTPPPLPQPPIGNAFAPPEVEELRAEQEKVSRETQPVNSVQAPTAPPRNLFSGQIQNLQVFGINGSSQDPLPGYEGYWFTDEGGTGARLNQAKASGWEFVQKSEVAMQDNLVEGNNDLGNIVRKVVNANRTPVEYGYLMKKPKWLAELHKKEMEEVVNRQEGAIKKGSFNSRPEDGRYVAGDMPGSTLPKIEITSNLKVPR